MRLTPAAVSYGALTAIEQWTRRGSAGPKNGGMKPRPWKTKNRGNLTFGAFEPQIVRSDQSISALNSQKWRSLSALSAN
jgi:hypothetical protein